MDKNEIKSYLNDLYYQANDEEELEFITDFANNILIDIKHLDNINIDGVEAAHWPFDVEIDYLREDEVDHLLTNEEVLENAAQKQDGFVKYLKVV